MKRPLVLLHGFLGAPSMWEPIEKFVEPSAIANRLVLPGHGASPWFPPEPADFLASVDAVAKSVSDSTKSMVVGYSMGARVALALTLRHPEKIARAILIGVDPGIEDEAGRAERIAWDDAWAARAQNESLDAFADAWENLPIFDTQKKLSEEARARLREQRTSHTSTGIAWAMRALGLGRMPNLWPMLEKNEVPLTLISGARDHKFTDKSRAIVTRGRNARAVVVENVGHNVALEAPQAVANEVNLALADLSARAGEREMR